VSVVLPVRNEAAHIEAVLGDVLAQEVDAPFEVLVVDGRSTDATREVVGRVAARDGRVRLLDNPARLSSAARALGVKEAQGDVVAFVDGHCHLPGTSLLSDMLALFERTGAACLARPQPLKGRGWGGRAVAAARTSPFGHSTASTIYDHAEREVSPVSAGAMYRREVFEQVGSFDPAFDACEDVELNWRVAAAGLSCWSSPKLAVTYEARRSLPALFRQMVRYGRGRARLARKHPAARSWEAWIPVGFVLGLPVLAASAWLPFPWSLPAPASYGLWLVLAILFSVGAARRHGFDLLPLLPFVFFTIHAGLGVGTLIGTFERWPRHAEAA
jgi:succinoglycan biosynthesis protein ExoA